MKNYGRKNVFILGANKELQEELFNLTYPGRRLSFIYDDYLFNFKDYNHRDIIVILTKINLEISKLNQLFNLNASIIISHTHGCEILSSKIKDYSLYFPIYELDSQNPHYIVYAINYMLRQNYPGIYSKKDLIVSNYKNKVS